MIVLAPYRKIVFLYPDKANAPMEKSENCSRRRRKRRSANQCVVANCRALERPALGNSGYFHRQRPRSQNLAGLLLDIQFNLALAQSIHGDLQSAAALGERS